MDGDVQTILPQDAADGAGHVAWFEDHVIVHLPVDFSGCKDKEKLSVPNSHAL